MRRIFGFLFILLGSSGYDSVMAQSTGSAGLRRYGPGYKPDVTFSKEVVRLLQEHCLILLSSFVILLVA